MPGTILGISMGLFHKIFDAVARKTLYYPYYPRLDGFEDPKNVGVSYSSTNRQMTFTHPSGTVALWHRGMRYAFSSPYTPSAQHSSSPGRYFLYMADGGTPVWSSVVWDLYTQSPMAIANYNNPTGISFGLRECHGLMDAETHEELHDKVGTYRKSGGSLTAGTYVVQGSTSDTQVTPGTDEAVIKDEDLLTTVPAWLEGSYTRIHLISSVATFTKASALPYPVSANTIQYNPGGTSLAVAPANNSYINIYTIYLPVTSDAESQEFRVLWMTGQNSYTSLATAQAEDLRAFNWGDIESLIAEFIPYVQTTYRYNTGYATTGRVRIEANPVYISGSKASLVALSGLTPTTHNNLSGRTDPSCHPASAIDNTPSGDVTSTTVQLAINELDTLIDTKRQYLSVGVFQATPPSLVDNGNGTCNIDSCLFLMHSTSDFTGEINKYTVPSATNVGPFDGTGKYLCVDYNSGSPIYAVHTSSTVNGSNIVPIYKCWWDGTYLHSLDADAQGLGLSNKVSNMILSTTPYSRASQAGLALSESATRIINIGSAYVYAGTTGIPVLQYTSSTDLLTFAYYNGSAWVYDRSSTQYDNTQYNPITGLATLSNNKFGVIWVYRSIGDVKEAFYVLGDSQYNNVGEAQLAKRRSDLPPLVAQHCMLVGRFIFQKGASAASSVESAFDTAFQASSVTAHNDLSGRSDADCHPGSAISLTASGTQTYTDVAASIQHLYDKYPGFHDYVETVSGSTKTVFTIDYDFAADHKIDVSIDGRDQPIENTHWSRDAGTNQITMTEPINVGSVFKCRIYLK